MPLSTHVDEQPTMNLTSMIDVVLLLLIFFMVGTKFSEMERHLDFQLPRVENSQALSSTPSRHEVSVAATGQVALNGKLVSLDELGKALADARRTEPRVRVIVRGEASGPFQNVAEVLRSCRDAGIGDLAISVRIADQRR